MTRSLATVALLMCLATQPAAQSWGEWELILTYFEIGAEPESRFYGIMVSREACHMAGEAMAEKLTLAQPTIAIGVTCRLRVSA